MPDVLVRDVPIEVLDALKERARQNKRSLQGELQLILEQAARTTMADARKIAAKIRRSLLHSAHTDSAALLREDRER